MEIQKLTAEEKYGIKIPKYVQNIMHRAKYEYDFFYNHSEYAVGYTIRITKATPYTKIYTFKTELETLKKWVERNGGKMIILHIPNETHYINQYAIVTIYDPIMKYIEGYIQ